MKRCLVERFQAGIDEIQCGQIELNESQLASYTWPLRTFSFLDRMERDKSLQKL